MKIRALIMFVLGAVSVEGCGGKHPLSNDAGARDASRVDGRDGAASTGAAGTGAAGSSSHAGTVGSAGTYGAAGTPGTAGTGGYAGTYGYGGSYGTGAAGIGAVGTGFAGTYGYAGSYGTGTAGTYGTGAAGIGAVGTGFAGSYGYAGTTGTGAAGTGARPVYVPTIPITAGDKPFTNPSNVSGTWTGYFENYQFRSGSDSLVLTFGKDAQGQGTLRVVLGEGVPPAPPTDPTKRWPASLDFDVFSGAAQLEGFEYPAHEVRWQGQRLTFKLAVAEAWTPWCSLQTSYKLLEGTGDYGYNCVPGNGGSYSENECYASDWGMNTRVPCDQFHMCSGGYCTCNATGCGPVVVHDRAFDITFNVSLASGSGYVDDGLRNLHLMAGAN